MQVEIMGIAYDIKPVSGKQISQIAGDDSNDTEVVHAYIENSKATIWYNTDLPSNVQALAIIHEIIHVGDILTCNEGTLTEPQVQTAALSVCTALTSSQELRDFLLEPSVRFIDPTWTGVICPVCGVNINSLEEPKHRLVHWTGKTVESFTFCSEKLKEAREEKPEDFKLQKSNNYMPGTTIDLDRLKKPRERSYAEMTAEAFKNLTEDEKERTDEEK